MLYLPRMSESECGLAVRLHAKCYRCSVLCSARTLREIHGKPHGEWQAGDGGEVDNLFRAWIDIESVNIPSPLAMLAVQNHEVVIEFHIGESDISPVLMPACTNRPR
jgi:hypothetical protein